jgi:hypothetical protein
VPSHPAQHSHVITCSLRRTRVTTRASRHLTPTSTTPLTRRCSPISFHSGEGGRGEGTRGAPRDASSAAQRPPTHSRHRRRPHAVARRRRQRRRLRALRTTRRRTFPQREAIAAPTTSRPVDCGGYHFLANRPTQRERQPATEPTALATRHQAQIAPRRRPATRRLARLQRLHSRASRRWWRRRLATR